MTDPQVSRAAPENREELRRQSATAFRRSIGLTALGTVVPGAGLTQTRNRRLGWALFALAAVVAVALAFVVMTKGVTATALSVVSRPGTLQWLVIGFVVAGLIWSASIVLTAVQTRPGRLDRVHTRWLAAFTTVMVLLVASSSLKAAEYAAITQQTVNDVFGAKPDQPGQGAHVAQGDNPWAQTPRVNMLLIGSDAGSDRVGIRTDSMIVASIDTASGRTTLIQLPRNLLDAPLAENSPLRARYPSGHFGQPDRTCAQNGGGATGQCMLTNLYVEAQTYAKTHPGAYPAGATPGRVEIRGTVAQITGLHIDQMVVIDLKGFQQLIDAMGGLDINVKLSGVGTKLTIGGQHDASGRLFGVNGYLEPGRQHLDGYHSLWYARTRAADDDNFRQDRQRCVVQAIVQQVNPAEMVSKYPEVVAIAKDNIYTDIPASSLPAFVDLVERVQKAKITSIALTQAKGVKSGDPDYALIRELVAKAIAAPATSAPPASGTQPPKLIGSAPVTTTPDAATSTPYSEC